jgi:hypothetical protein
MTLFQARNVDNKFANLYPMPYAPDFECFLFFHELSGGPTTIDILISIVENFIIR